MLMKRRFALFLHCFCKVFISILRNDHISIKHENKISSETDNASVEKDAKL